MPIVINWVKNYHETGQIFTLPTLAGNLAVTLSGNVIINTDWLLAEGIYPPIGESWLQRFEGFWSGSDEPIELALMAQGSPFRRRVWEALSQIPFGGQVSYKTLAGALQSSPRAIGNACRDNPYAPFIPCHRVVSTSGLGGYCGKTEGPLMAIKHKLLQHEAQQRQ